MTARRKENAVFRVIEMVHIEKKEPLEFLLVVFALFTNKPLDFNSEVNLRFCFFRRECRRLLLRPPAPPDIFLNKVAFAAVVEAVNPIKSVVVVPSPSLDMAAASGTTTTT